MSDESGLPKDGSAEVQVTKPTTGHNVESLRTELSRSKKTISDLIAANAKWETHTHQLNIDHEQELASVNKDLRDSKQRLTGLLIEKESLEEQKDKAVKLVLQQTNKIDELKVKLHGEKVKVEQLEEKKTYLDKAIENLRRENAQLHGKPVPMDTSSGSHDECRRRLKEEKDENIVLKEQLKIFKADFDQERKDREHAQSGMTRVETDLKKATERIRRIESNLVQKEKENAALKETNRELQRKYEQVHQKLQKQGKAQGSNYDIHIHSKPEDRRRRKSPSPGDRPPVTDSLITDQQKRHIRSNWMQFLEYLRLDDVLPRLFSVGVVSLMEKEEIESKPTSSLKNEHFMTHTVLRATQNDLRHLKSALIDSYQKHVADLLPPTHTAKPTPVQEEPMDIPREEAYPWQCKDCTFKNSSTSSHCEMCNVERPRRPMETLMGRGVDQCDNNSQQRNYHFMQDDVEEDLK